MRQTLSGHLSRYIALSVCIHLVSISFVFHLLYVPTAPLPRSEPVRVTLVAPDLPASPLPALTSRFATLPQAIAPTAAEAFRPTLPAPSVVASTALPEVVPLPMPTAMQPSKATLHTPLPQLDLPAKVPELEPTPTPRTTLRPTPTPMISETPPASSPIATSHATPIPPMPSGSLAPIRPPQDAPRPLVPAVSGVGKVPELSPMTVSRSMPTPGATTPLTEPTATPPAVLTVPSVSTSAVPPPPQTSRPASSTPIARRTLPPVAPVSVPAPSVATLPQVSSTPRTTPPPRQLSSPSVPAEAPQQPIVTTRAPAPPPPSNAESMVPQRVPQRQVIANQSSQELPSLPHMAKPPSIPSFVPANPGQQTARLHTGSTPTISPRFAAKPCPKYPLIARRRKSEGVVVVAFDVSADGRIDNVKVIQSSGDASLDDEAEKTVKIWRPVPEAFAHSPVTRLTVPFRFELEELHNPKRSDRPTALDGERVICDGQSQHG